MVLTVLTSRCSLIVFFPGDFIKFLRDAWFRQDSNVQKAKLLGTGPHLFPRRGLGGNQIAQHGAQEESVDHPLDLAPKGADGAVGRVDAKPSVAGVALAQTRLEHAPAQGRQDLRSANLLRRPGQVISTVTTSLTLDQLCLGQDPKDLPRVLLGQAFLLRDVADRNRGSRDRGRRNRSKGL